MKFSTGILILLLLSSVLWPSCLQADESSSCLDCHRSSVITFEESVHGGKVPGISPGAPVDCMSCHRDHGNEDFQISNLPVIRGNDIITCGDCHIKERSIYFQTYHGKHLALGKKNVPTCTFCHAGHERPKTDISSPINYTNIGRVCAGCHGESDNDKIQMSSTLSTPLTGRILYNKDAVAHIIDGMMEALSIVIFLFGLLFIMQWIRNLRGEPLQRGPGWPGWVWIQLLVFLIFFVIDEQTGVTLLYSTPEGGFIHRAMFTLGKMVMSIVGTDDYRSLIHRLGGIGFLIILIIHILCLILSPSFRSMVRLPAKWWQSLAREVRQGIRPAGNFSSVKYILLYWILIGGAIIMAITGIAQWNAFWLMKSAGLWPVRYAEIIHLWTGRIMVMVVYAMGIGYGFILKPIARRIHAGRYGHI